jgi:pimeloyl-ACP methyl ester carboxylesterase
MRADLARRAFGDVARQSAKSWYIGVFHLPMLAPILWASGLFGKALQRVIAAEGARSEAPAIADGTRGIRLYRANMLPRLLAPRDRRTNVPVQFIVPRRDAYVSPWLSTGLDDRIPVAFRREVEGRHWLPLSQPENVARWVDEMVRFTEGEDVGPDFARLRGTGASQR